LGDDFYAPMRRAKGTQVKQDQQAAFIKEVMAKLKQDAFVPGELDIKPDLESLIAFQKETKIPILAGNMVDPDSGKVIFESSRIVKRNGIRIALVGVLGPEAFEIVPANQDYNPQAAKSMKSAGMKTKNKKLLKSQMAKLKQQGELSGQAADQIAKLSAALEGQDAQEEKSDEAKADTPAFEYKGRRFKITDPVAFVAKELAQLRGKADLYVLLGHMTKTESDNLRLKAAGYNLFLDGHGQGKSHYFKDDGGAPHRIRGGNRGRNITLAKVIIKDGGYEFEDRSSFERDKSSLKRQKKSLKRQMSNIGGEDLFAQLPEDDRKRKRVEQVKKRIVELEAKLTKKGTGSYFETQQITLDSKIVSDPEIEKRQTEIAGTKPAKKKSTPKTIKVKKKSP
jgi:2',3'-cyclic-nucleotide 2'-phosphodiesterase (5'-nucleotidase family)